MSLKRFFVCGVCATVITIGLGHAMQAMIAVEFEAQDEFDVLDFAIRVEPPEVIPPQERTKPKDLKRVETPPPPPTTGYDKAKQPTEKFVEDLPPPPPLDAPDIDFDGPIIQVGTGELTPLVRIPGQMPPRATRSGHCKLGFSVSADGAPYNVEAIYCSQKIFERPSIKAAQKFKYRPRRVKGRAVPMNGVTTTIKYVLTDERGQIIPE